MEQVIERVAKAPLGIKIVALVGALLLVTGVNYAVVGVPFGRSIMDIDTRIDRAQDDFKKANAQYIEKQAIANDLNRFRREKEILQQRFEEAKAELPDSVQIDELLASFQDRAQKVGVELVSFEPKGQSGGGQFYASLPISVSASGSFHEIASFLDALGKLRRIVNVSDLVLDGPKDVSGKVVLTAKFTATTFMFVEQPVATPTKGKKAK